MRQLDRLIICLLQAIIVSAMLTSCRDIPKTDHLIDINEIPKASAGYTPKCWILYYPSFQNSDAMPVGTPVYGKSPEQLSEVRAVHDHVGSWTDADMNYDIAEIQSTGFDGIMLAVSPEDLVNETRCGRILQFFKLVADARPKLDIGLYIYSKTPLVMGSGNIAQFLIEKGFISPKAVPPLPRLLVLFASEGITINHQNFAEEKQFEMHFEGSPDGIWTFPSSVNRFEPRISNNRCSVAIANCGHKSGISWSAQHGWKLPRGDGSFFRNNIRLAFKQSPRDILFFSWNNFSDGSFMVANTFDNDLFIRIFKEEKKAILNRK